MRKFILVLALLLGGAVHAQQVVVDVRAERDVGRAVEASRIQFGADYWNGGATSDEAETFIRAVVDLVGGNKEKPVILLCNAGVRSREAQLLLELSGFNKVKAMRVAEFLESQQVAFQASP